MWFIAIRRMLKGKWFKKKKNDEDAQALAGIKRSLKIQKGRGQFYLWILWSGKIGLKILSMAKNEEDGKGRGRQGLKFT